MEIVKHQVEVLGNYSLNRILLFMRVCLYLAAMSVQHFRLAGTSIVEHSR